MYNHVWNLQRHGFLLNAQNNMFKIHTRDKHPLPPPTLKGLIYVRMEMLLNMVFKLIFTDLETRLYIV